MKRSEALDMIAKVIRTENTGHYSYDSKRHADKLLKTIETFMIPNWKWKKPEGYESNGCLCTMREHCKECIPEGFTMNRDDWEPDGKKT